MMRPKKKLLKEAHKENRKVELFQISYGQTYDPIYKVIETHLSGDETHSRAQAEAAFDLIKAELEK